jgi:probable phosphoglycerate mutase
MDSKLVVEQMSGRWQVKHEAMKPLAREANELRRRFAAATFTWIPRAQNSHADRLANEAMDAAAGILPRPARTASASTPAPATSWIPPDTRPTRFVLVRHGATQHSAERRFSGRNDLPLDDTGAAQAAALGERLKGLRSARAVVTSPLRRARETADAIAAAAGLAVEQDDNLIETDFGAWEGLTYGEAGERFPDELAAWLASPEQPPPRGEAFTTVGRRVRRARDAIIAAHPGETVIVVSHVTPIKSLLRAALDAPPIALFRIQLDTASISQIDYYADGNCAVRLVNDTSHLR